MEGAGGPPHFEFNVPDELRAGRYANILGVWHSPHEFTLDFSVSAQAVPGDPPIVPCDVVARIKVAPSLVFDLLQALNENMSRYERDYGEIRRPEPPGEPTS